MFRFFSILFTLAAFHSCFADRCPLCAQILEGKIPSYDRRYDTFLYALELLKERHATTLVETGTARGGLSNCIGDGCSTMLFAEWAKKHNADFYSVDIDPFSIMNAAKDLKDLKPFAKLVCSDSIVFLQHFSRSIDFLYLDSFDFDANNPSPSQEHHLKEIIAAYPCLNSNSVIMIDDCALPHGGKGKLVIDYLLDRGWEIIASGYQVILSKKK